MVAGTACTRLLRMGDEPGARHTGAIGRAAGKFDQPEGLPGRAAPLRRASGNARGKGGVSQEPLRHRRAPFLGSAALTNAPLRA